MQPHAYFVGRDAVEWQDEVLWPGGNCNNSITCMVREFTHFDFRTAYCEAGLVLPGLYRVEHCAPSSFT